jgi:putative glutamine amidotransferase
LDYVDAVLNAGGVPILLPRVSNSAAIRAAALCADGVLFTGGGDVISLAYGEEPHPTSNDVDPVRDEMELVLAGIAEEIGLPVLGICRGIQLLNVAAGGTLFQDIPDQVPGAHQHQTHAIDAVKAHTVDIEPDSRLAPIVGAASTRVNSRHHQAVKDVGRGFRVVARARDGVVEAIEASDERALLAVQWHPEELARTDPSFHGLFVWLVNEARRYRQRHGALAGASETSTSAPLSRPVSFPDEAEHGAGAAFSSPLYRLRSMLDDPPDEGEGVGPNTENPVNRIACALLQEAIRQAATEIHLDSSAKGVRVRFAVGKTLDEIMTMPKHVEKMLVDCYRSMAGLETGDRSTHQEGTIRGREELKNHVITLRFQPEPTGESVYMRIE